MKANQLLKTGRGHQSPCRFLKRSTTIGEKFCLLLKYLQVIDDEEEPSVSYRKLVARSIIRVNVDAKVLEVDDDDQKN